MAPSTSCTSTGPTGTPGTPGWAADLDPRLAEHAAGTGARLPAVVRTAGIGWTLARTWTGTRARERQLKRQGGASRRCPLCGGQPRTR